MIKVSFEQWCLENNRYDLIDLWDEDLNNLSPAKVSRGQNKKYWFRCARGLHESKLVSLNYLTSRPGKVPKCDKCSSIAQYILDHDGSDRFDEIQKMNPTLDLYSIKHGSLNEKDQFELRCSKKHPIYKIKPARYTEFPGCPYCAGQRVCEENSLGYNYPEALTYWSDKNDKTPMDYNHHSSIKVWWKCKNNIHNDYLRKVENAVDYDFRCPMCSRLSQAIKVREDLTGRIFGRLTVVKLDVDNQKDGAYWWCQCSCGSPLKSISANSLRKGVIVSCGCYHIEQISGENAHNWRGGISSKNHIERGSYKYKEFCKQVYKKDHYTCQCCGKCTSFKKNAHHILSFANHSDLRYDLDNAITLCEECHLPRYEGSLHAQYGLDPTPAQLETYINEKRKQLGIDIPFSIKAYNSGDRLSPTSLLHADSLPSIS